ncbi:MAG: MFS transporter [Candidatus Magasanikbacteria bacterium CG11_big_fil_rev_8_21_14_0_20_39_34]|uniref:MFS transporter n=1 Tax=Candidatus Magasanikbacteria bacterium CG11_big_fil_rev_8_21_14_0_20_39_34 TaxID=1974653 RepID=A0A2H0N511_9BACT|nr:MAG: MFS transporter [Candidatus Magasanikbacteria bacterium CG11_big_fil_rev_8_21_14_0_20_39_34]
MNKNIKILLLGANIWFFGEGLLGPLFAVYTQKVGGDVLDISWAWATYLILAGCLYILVGKLTDKHNNKEKVMVIGYALNAIMTFGYLLVSVPWHLFVVQAGLGVAVAMSTPTWNALYAKYSDKEYDGFLWGLAGGMAQICTGLAIIVGGYIVSYGSFKILFITMGTLQTISTIYQAQILKNN